MTQKAAKVQAQPADVSVNGDGQVHLATAETAAPERDIAPEIEVERLENAEGSVSFTPKTTRFSDYVLSDEDEDDDNEPILTKCPARKPNEFDVFQVRPGSEWTMEILIVEYRGDDAAVPRGFYMIHPKLRRAFGKKGRKHLIVTCVNTNGSMFLWPIKLTEGFGDSWCKSALRVVKAAENTWVKDFISGGNGYDVSRSTREHGKPRWLGQDLDELLDFAFDGRIVSERTHPLCVALEIE